jgi:hypothetical protein
LRLVAERDIRRDGFTALEELLQVEEVDALRVETETVVAMPVRAACERPRRALGATATSCGRAD